MPDIIEEHILMPSGTRLYRLQGSPVWLDRYDTGFMLAHDLMEHQNGAACIGSAKDELEAFGAIWATRSRQPKASAFGPKHRHGTPGREYMLRNLAQIFLRRTPGDFQRFHPNYWRERPSIRDEFIEITHDALERVELDRHLNSSDLRELNNYKSYAAILMQQGYEKMLNRWSVSDDETERVTNLFFQLETDLDDIFRRNRWSKVYDAGIGPSCPFVGRSVYDDMYRKAVKVQITSDLVALTSFVEIDT